MARRLRSARAAAGWAYHAGANETITLHRAAGAERMASMTLQSLRRHLLPPHLDDLGWAPVWSLLYLGFLFMTWDSPTSNWVRPTLVSMAIFLPVYFRCYWLTGWRQLAHLAAIAALA